MSRWVISLALFLTGVSWGQFVNRVRYVTNSPTGSCGTDPNLYIKISDGTLTVCKNTTYGQPPGGAASAGGTNGQLQVNASGSIGGITAGGDVTFATPNFTVTGLNGTNLAGLATGILKITTGTGVPSIAVAGDFPTLNQNTTGSAASATTATTATNIASGAANQIPFQSGGGTTAFSSDFIYNNASKIQTITGGVVAGLAGTATGTYKINGTTSGTITITGAAAAGTWSMVLPITAGTAGQPLLSNAGGTMTWGSLTGNTTTFVTSTGAATSTAAVKFDASGNAIASGCTIDASNNLSCPGTITGGSASGNTGYLQLNGATSGSVLFTVPNVAGTQDAYVFPNPNSGTANQFLQLGTTGTCPTGVPGVCYSVAWASPAGSGTVASSTIGQVGVYTGATTVTGNANLTMSSSALTVGVAGAAQGTVLLAGSGSGSTTLAAQSSGGGTMTFQAGSDTVVGRATTDTLTNKTVNCANNTCTVRVADITNTTPLITTTVGTTRTISNAFGELIICTGACTVTPPATGSTVAGMQFCVQNDDNVATAITIAGVASVQYETTARTSYKSTNTSLASTGAVKDQICMSAKDATHWNVWSSVGTWN